MTVARSVADVLDEHVLFEVESIDRMYLNVWQPRLAYGGGVQGFFVGHRGHRGHHGADGPDDQGVGRRHPRLRRRLKDDIAQEFLAKFTQDEGVLFVGRAQEKAGVWRTQRRHNPPSGVAMPGWCAPRRSSTSSTSTAWTPNSARSLSVQHLLPTCRRSGLTKLGAVGSGRRR
jgi:hypothetical protein